MLRYLLFLGPRGHGVHHVSPYLRLCGFVQRAEEEGDSRNKSPRLAVDLSTGGLRRQTRTVEAAPQTRIGRRGLGMRTGKSKQASLHAATSCCPAQLSLPAKLKIARNRFS